MSQPENSSLDYRFELLMHLHESADQAEKLSHYAHLLRMGPSILDPLAEFIIRQPNEPRLAVLIELLAKIGDSSAVPILMRFTEIDVTELRLAAVLGLGWLRSPAAIERLDQLSAKDPEARVRDEAEAALNEILRAYPNLASLLHFYKPPAAEAAHVVEAAQAAHHRHDTAPDLLVRLMPRLVARRFHAVPIRITEMGRLVVAVRDSHVANVREALEELYGTEIEAKPLPDQQYHAQFEKLYSAGDADFVGDIANLSRPIRLQVSQIILEGVTPDEPVSPLDEATDAVEAAQILLSLAASGSGGRALIDQRDDDTLRIVVAHGPHELSLVPPSPDFAPGFVAILLMLAGIDPAGLGATSGSFRLADPAFHFDVAVGSFERGLIRNLELKARPGA